MNVYLLWREEEGENGWGEWITEDVLEGVYATKVAAEQRADKGMGIVLSPNTYRIERRKVLG
jgi:hypothetical protein